MVKVELGQLWRDKDKGLRLAKVVGFAPTSGEWTMVWVDHPNAAEIGKDWPSRTTASFLDSDYKLEGVVPKFKAGDVVNFAGDHEDYTVLAAHGNHVWLDTALVPKTVSTTSVHHKPTFFEVGKTYVSKNYNGSHAQYKVESVIDRFGGKWAVAEYRFWSAVERKWKKDEDEILVLTEGDWPMEEKS